MNTWRKNQSTDMGAVIKFIQQPQKSLHHNKAIKHGITTESEAKVKFSSIYENDGHTDIEICESGLHLDPRYGYLGASPDLIVKCSCCGKGVVEIKCPLTSYGNQPIDENVSCLAKDATSGKLYLKKSDKYFTQIQGQMGLTTTNFCEFLIYNGEDNYHKERIMFDPIYWSSVHANLNMFFTEVLSSITQVITCTPKYPWYGHSDTLYNAY
jgi:hypothetical protein